MKRTKIDKKFLEEVAEQHNKDYPPAYWENGGKQQDWKKRFRDKFASRWLELDTEDFNVATMEEVEEFIRDELKRQRQETAKELVDTIIEIYERQMGILRTEALQVWKQDLPILKKQLLGFIEEAYDK